MGGPKTKTKQNKMAEVSIFLSTVHASYVVELIVLYKKAYAHPDEGDEGLALLKYFIIHEDLIE